MAKENAAELLADEILQIADDGSNDKTTDNEGNVIVNTDHIARSRLRVDARKWVACHLNPKLFGEKKAVTHEAAEGSSLDAFFKSITQSDNGRIKIA